MFCGIQWYTCIHTKTIYNVCAHNSLPASAILALGLLKKKRKMMNNFVWVVITLLRICGALQAYFGSLKGCYQCGFYCRECLYSQISVKVWDSEEKMAFSSRFPLRCHIERLGTFFCGSWHCCKLLCERSSSNHNSSYWWVNDILTQWRQFRWSWVDWV